jgi:hypothetical protein
LQNAAASPEFPYDLRDVANMTCTPSCTVCHTTEPGRRGTANKAFAVAMSAAGLEPSKDETVAPAFEALQAMNADTDGDGALDAEELAATLPSDPNDPMLTPTMPGDGMCAADVLYGCGAHVASRPESGGSGWALLAALLSFAVLMRARLRRH